jgi:hypothetical protein
VLWCDGSLAGYAQMCNLMASWLNMAGVRRESSFGFGFGFGFWFRGFFFAGD